MTPRRSLGWPITLGVVMIVLLVALTVGWIVLNLAGFFTTNRAVYVAILAIGTTFFVLVLIGVVLYLLLAVKAIALNQRQSNFIDSVTHELKSPIASLKLYLQTLERRKLTEAQQADFHRFMLEDLQRLDRMIDHMLDAARLDQLPKEAELADVDLNQVLVHCARTVCQDYRRPESIIQLDMQPAVLRARPMDVEMIFRNLMDNAVKYAGDDPKVEVECKSRTPGRILVRVKDNGPGIPLKFRRKVFLRFFRLGSELERSKTGTGLGLFIVRTLVHRLKGKVTVRGRGNQSGTVFEVELPGEVGEKSGGTSVSPVK